MFMICRLADGNVYLTTKGQMQGFSFDPCDPDDFAAVQKLYLTILSERQKKNKPNTVSFFRRVLDKISA